MERIFEKMSDGDVMVYVRNTMLSLLQLSQERQIPIDIFAGSNGCAKARAGDYVVFNYTDGHIEYSYEPINGKESTFRDWKNYIPPQSIRFGRPPKEEEE